MATLDSLRNLARFTARPGLVSAIHGRTLTSTGRRLQTIPFEIRGVGDGVAQNVFVKGSSHKLSTDAYPAFGGKDASPSPLHFNLTSLSSCTQVTGSLVAKDLAIKLGEWNVEVAGHLDPGVLVEGKEGNANWKSISLKVRLQADADKAKFAKLASETERRCPVTQLVSTAIKAFRSLLTRAQFKRSGVEWSSDWQNKS